MFNNSTFNEEAKLKIAEREREAESYRLYRQLGYSTRRPITRLVVALIALVIAMVLFMVLL